MDQAICTRFADLTLAAARGEPDHRASTPRGRLALLLALDQFPRSLWRDTPAAFAQDIKTTRLALDGIDHGHVKAVAPWERLFSAIALGHCEGPDHLDRITLMERLRDDLITDLHRQRRPPPPGQGSPPRMKAAPRSIAGCAAAHRPLAAARCLRHARFATRRRRTILAAETCNRRHPFPSPNIPAGGIRPRPQAAECHRLHRCPGAPPLPLRGEGPGVGGRRSKA